MVGAISTYSLSNDLRHAIMEMQARLNKSQREMSSGRVANLSEALGVDVSRDFAFGIRKDDLHAISQTNDVVASRLDATQASLDSIVQTAKDFRSALILAQKDGSAAALQSEATTALSTFIATLNTTAAGEYVFGGVNTDIAPIVDYFATPPAANKQALDTQFLATFGAPQSNPVVSSITASQMQSFLNGSFANLFATGNWTAGWSNASSQTIQSRISLSQTQVTSVTANDPALQKLAAAYTMVSDLGLDSLSTPAYETVVQNAIQYVDDAITGLIQLQASVGVMQKNVATANDQISSQDGLLQTYIGQLEDVDPAEAASKANDLMTQIETAYSLTSKISQLSLVKYL